jgi:hypothetical protein
LISTRSRTRCPQDFPHPSRPALGPTTASCTMGNRVSLPGVKLQGRGTDSGHSSPLLFNLSKSKIISHAYNTSRSLHHDSRNLEIWQRTIKWGSLQQFRTTRLLNRFWVTANHEKTHHEKTHHEDNTQPCRRENNTMSASMSLCLH